MGKRTTKKKQGYLSDLEEELISLLPCTSCDNPLSILEMSSYEPQIGAFGS